MSTWTLTYQGPNGIAPVTNDFATWGLGRLKRTLRSHEVDKVTFVAPGTGLDADALFQDFTTVQIRRNGTLWFTGVVTGIPRAGEPSGESMSYEISGPWWFLDRLVFQQTWQYVSNTGEALALVPTTQSLVVIGQGPTGVSEDLGMMMTEVLQYCIAAGANGMIIDPTTGTSVPPFTPFAIGTMTPDTIIPFEEIRDRTCSQVINRCLHWIPDAVTWFDYTQEIPVLNIAQRSTLPSVSIPVAAGSIASRLKIKARYDLQVTNVICKYRQSNTVNGTTYSSQLVDKYPVDSPDSNFRGLVADVDLLGGNSTFQKQAVTVRDRPRTAADSVALSWVTKKMPWLFAQTPAEGYSVAAYSYDIANIAVSTVATALDPDDPANTNPPTGFSLNALTEELMAGAIAPWMVANDGVFAAKVIVTVTLVYSGSDATTLALFQNNPAAPNTRVEVFGITATNAASQTYQELTSFTEPEPAPTGLAQTLYQALSVLHYEGSILLSEPEVSGLAPIGCVLNFSGSRAEWQAMNALVVEVSEDVDPGRTTVNFGPPLALNLRDWTQMLRASRGRLFSTHAQNRTSGQATAGSNVTGHTHGADNTSSSVPGGGGGVADPFTVSVTNAATPPATPSYRAATAFGFLFQDASQQVSVAITNLSPSPGIPVLGTDDVWLQGTVNENGVVLTCQINTTGNGGSFNPSSDIQIGTSLAWVNFAYRGGGSGAYPDVVQTGFCLLLASVTAGSGPGVPPVVSQRVRSHLVMAASTAFDSTGRAFPVVFPTPL